MCIEGFNIETCPECGIRFGLETNYQNRLRKCHNTFYCPNGHGQYYSRLNAEEQLRNQVKQLESLCADTAKRAGKAERKARALKGALTKAKKGK